MPATYPDGLRTISAFGWPVLLEVASSEFLQGIGKHGIPSLEGIQEDECICYTLEKSRRCAFRDTSRDPADANV